MNLELKGYSFDAQLEDTRAPRRVRVGLIQNTIVLPTSDPIIAQRDALFEKIGKIIGIAHQCGVNIIYMPCAFCTREKHPWCQFAESAEDGPTTLFLQEVNSTVLDTN